MATQCLFHDGRSWNVGSYNLRRMVVGNHRKVSVIKIVFLVYLLILIGLNPGEVPLVFITHDESTFNANDGKRKIWKEEGKNPLRSKARRKGIMVSGFLTPGGVPCFAASPFLKPLPPLSFRCIMERSQFLLFLPPPLPSSSSLLLPRRYPA